MLSNDLEAIHAEAKSFATTIERKLVANVASEFTAGKGAGGLIRSLRGRVRLRSGEVIGVGISMARHGVFVEKGVGRGRKKGSGRERPHPWFSPIVDPELEAFANRLQEAFALTVTNNLYIK